MTLFEYTTFVVACTLIIFQGLIVLWLYQLTYKLTATQPREAKGVTPVPTHILRNILTGKWAAGDRGLTRRIERWTIG